uniref:Ras-GEF domain-containing protein n=1 Tax=Macrostomum lignano TaxID=282301 RepID=A0A1I8HR66_9PLAT
LKQTFSQATDDTNLVIRRIHEKCRAVLATIAYLRRIFLRKEALSQLEALQFLLLGQHQEIIHAVNAVCHELLQKQRQEFNSLMSAANGTLAVLCCWLDKALLSSDAFNHIAGNGLISGYQGKIEALIATCQGLPMDSLDWNSLPTASELDRCLDDEKMMQSILTVSQRLKSLQGPSADDPAAGASASFLAAGTDNGSSVGSTDSIGSSVESGGSEDSTQSEEEFTEDLVSVNGVLYKRKVRKRRRQKVVRTRTVVMSSGPPLALTATDCLALGPAQPQLPLPPHLQEQQQQQQLAASSEAGRDASFRSDATSGYHSIMSGASDFPPPPPPPPPQQQKQQPSPASQPDGSPPPKPPPPGSVSDPMSESVMLAGYDRELTDFSRHSMDSFNMFHSRWHKLVSSDAPHERSKTISLVTHECRQPRAGLIVHRNTTISHTARVRHVPAASAAQQPPIPMADDLGSDEDAGAAPAAAAAPSAMPGGEDSLYEQLPPTPPTTKPLLSATSETAAAAAADASSEEPLEAYFYDQLEEFLVWDPATDPAVAEAEDRIRVRAGPLDALLVHACCPATEGARQHLLFCESLAATYRCFASSHELVGRIVSRAIFFLAAGRDLLWKPAFAFLVSSECDQEMLDDLGLLKQRLVGEGRLPEAQILATALAGVRQRQAEAAQPDPAAAAAASALAAQRRSITDFTPRQLAEQITLMDSRLYRRIEIQ